MHTSVFLSKYFPAPEFLDLPFVGIDISTFSMRLMEIKELPSPHVGKFDEVNFKEMFSDTSHEHKEVIDALKLWKKNHNLKYIKASIPEEKAYLFDTEVKYGPESDMRNSIEFSLEDNVPLPGSEVIFDYRLISESSQPGFIKVAVTVLPIETINFYVNIFSQCGLVPISFLIEAQALSRSLISKNDKGTHLIVNINQTRTGVSIVGNGAVQFTSTIQIGSRELKDSFEVSAATFKDEIDKVYIYWSKHKDNKIDKILLSGKEALAMGFQEYLSKSLRLTVEVGNVWTNLASFDKYIPPLPLDRAINFGVAIGMSLPEHE